jgi:hypothetical protein
VLVLVLLVLSGPQLLPLLVRPDPDSVLAA